MSNFRLLFLSALLGLLIAAVTSPAAAPAAPPDLAVTVQQSGGGAPGSYFVVGTAAGGRVPGGAVIVENDDERPVTVDVYPVAAVTAANLGSAYALRGERPGGPAAWTRASERRLSLAPGQSAVVQVGVDVPAGQADGEYLSGLAIEARGQAERPSDRGDVAIANAQRHVVGVQVNVGDARRPKLVFDGALVERQPAGVTFLIEMRNPGNVILQNVRGRVEVERDGRRVAAEPIGPGTFVSDTSIDFPVLARRENPPEGTEYRVRAVARYEGREIRLDEMVTFGTEAAERQERFGGRAVEDDFPWLWIVVAVLVALALLALALKLRRRGLPSLPETLALIEYELATNRPLTLIAVGPLPGGRRERRQFEQTLFGRLRGADLVCEPEPGTLVVVAPDTGEHAAAALLEDAQRLTESSGGHAVARGRTTMQPVTAAELLAAVLIVPALARAPMSEGSQAPAAGKP